MSNSYYSNYNSINWNFNSKYHNIWILWQLYIMDGWTIFSPSGRRSDNMGCWLFIISMVDYNSMELFYCLFYVKLVPRVLEWWTILNWHNIIKLQYGWFDWIHSTWWSHCLGSNLRWNTSTRIICKFHYHTIRIFHKLEDIEVVLNKQSYKIKQRLSSQQ